MLVRDCFSLIYELMFLVAQIVWTIHEGRIIAVAHNPHYNHVDVEARLSIIAIDTAKVETQPLPVKSSDVRDCG